MKTRSEASRKAEAAFRARVEELGGVLLESVWLGSTQPHRVRCPEGHEVAPRPQSLKAGNGLCSRCAQINHPVATGTAKRAQRSTTAEAAFRARVEELGGVVLEDGWKGNQQPHRVRCAAGHECAPRPNNVTQGSGFCLVCTWASQDVVYVVVDQSRQLVKFGITSGDPRPRLRSHASDGFTDVVMVRQGLPAGRAFQAEQDTIRLLRSYGVKPVQGREYFPASWLGVILDQLDAPA
jgi:hypothetical protein